MFQNRCCVGRRARILDHVKYDIQRALGRHRGLCHSRILLPEHSRLHHFVRALIPSISRYSTAILHADTVFRGRTLKACHICITPPSMSVRRRTAGVLLSRGISVVVNRNSMQDNEVLYSFEDLILLQYFLEWFHFPRIILGLERRRSTFSIVIYVMTSLVNARFVLKALRTVHIT